MALRGRRKLKQRDAEKDRARRNHGLELDVQGRLARPICPFPTKCEVPFGAGGVPSGQVVGGVVVDIFSPTTPPG